MTPADFVDSIENFSKLSFSEQIKRFCWYLSKRGTANFKGRDIARCFDEAHCPKPTSIGPFLSSLSKRKCPFLIRKNGSYCLSRSGRDQFDDSLGTRGATIAVLNLLNELPSKIPAECEKVYLEEALICFKHKAFRATIVMTWNLAYDHLCNIILNTHLLAFNAQLPKSFPKADISAVNVRDDFGALKESQVIQVAKSANIISNSVHKVLKEKLDRRNIAAHPSGIAISQLTAEEYVRDLIENVVLKY